MLPDVTRVAELTRVDVGVFLHIRLLVKPLSAVLTRKRTSVGVDQQVRGERGTPLEALVALITLRRRSHVNGTVSRLIKYMYIYVKIEYRVNTVKL